MTEELKQKAIEFEKKWFDKDIVISDLLIEFATEVIEELEKENAELKCECRRCVYTDCPCILSDYGKDKNGICDHFKDVFDENAELKAKWLQATDEGTSWAHLKSLEKESVEARKLLKMWIEPKYDREELLYLTEQFLKNDSCPDVMCEDCTKEDCGIKQLGLVGKVK